MPVDLSLPLDERVKLYLEAARAKTSSALRRAAPKPVSRFSKRVQAKLAKLPPAKRKRFAALISARDSRRALRGRAAA